MLVAWGGVVAVDSINFDAQLTGRLRAAQWAASAPDTTEPWIVAAYRSWDREVIVMRTPETPGAPGAGTPAEIVLVHRSGWPLRVFEGEERYDARQHDRFPRDSSLATALSLGSTLTLRHAWAPKGVTTPPPAAGRPPAPTQVASRLLPLRPRPGALLADTAAGAVAALLLLRLWTMPRRGLRRLRGRCPACAYDLRRSSAAGCPECGWRRVEAAGSGEPG